MPKYELTGAKGRYVVELDGDPTDEQAAGIVREIEGESAPVRETMRGGVGTPLPPVPAQMIAVQRQEIREAMTPGVGVARSRGPAVQAAAALEGAVSGGTLGLSDAAAAGILRSLGKRDVNLEGPGTPRGEYPGTALAGEIAGNLLVPTSGAYRLAMKAPSTGGKLLRLAGLGAAEAGTLAAAKDVSTGRTDSVPRDIMLASAIGGAAAPIGGGGAKVVSSVARLGGEGVAGMARALFTDNTVRLMEKAVMPPKKLAKIIAPTIERYMPLVDEHAAEMGVKLDNLESLHKVTQSAKAKTWATIEERVGAAEAGGLKINMGDVADQMVQAAKSRKLMREIETNPSLGNVLKAVETKAAAYRRPLGVKEAEEILEDTNAALKTSAYKAGYQGRVPPVEELARTDPQVAAELALANGLRKKLDETVSKLPGEFANLKRDYGALKVMGDAVSDRMIVEGRQRTMGLDRLTIGQAAMQSLEGPQGAASSLAKLAVVRALKRADSSDEMVRRAFEDFATKRAAKAGKAAKAGGATAAAVPAGLLLDSVIPEDRGDQ